MKIYRTRLEVRGYELDSFGHVNHANYLNYFEHARWEMLRSEGITLEVLQKWKRWPVIAKAEIKYMKPTFMGDILEVETRCNSQGKARFTIEQTIMKGTVAVTAATFQCVMVDENGRPAEYPEQLARTWS